MELSLFALQKLYYGVISLCIKATYQCICCCSTNYSCLNEAKTAAAAACQLPIRIDIKPKENTGKKTKQVGRLLKLTALICILEIK